ncbi:MSC_0619 family F1-like ATPase alpha subunit [Mesomycoplasma lagogenitalium]|uniref:ATP F0F1 synthase subunit alpha n=1 Tax=Mesomycoplasma lagogenitalium TaxID=171286 RepID=A0ABY8LY19_9BACT|nr:ATP F0F1 synthase subunit alpha [Mesomycoplasma lagogenitalium]WGI37032.1 ATP F0F1 synthase subunit alpha [Mesomycoplasma lagogenitalium]
MNEKVILKSINNFIIKVEGRFNYKQNQFFKINDKTKAFVLSANETSANLIISNQKNKLLIGQEILPIENNFIETKQEFFGNIIDINNKIVTQNNLKNGESKSFGFAKIFNKARGINERIYLNKPLTTGILGIDLFTPIGRGQRELIVGDRKTGKTTIALSAAINNKNDEKLKVIYASIGQKTTSVSEVYQLFKNHNILDKIMIIAASSDNSYEQFLLPYIAMAHAENLAKNNYDVLLILDDLTKHANIYREISLLIDRPAGREAYPGDIFFIHSKLLERSGNFKNEGSITTLPIVETIGGDITSFISSNIISITDGQIVTSTDFFNKGIIPAINYSVSVSRTGSAVQKPEIGKISKSLFKIYNNYQKNISLKDIKFNLSKEISSLLSRGKILNNFLTQTDFNLYDENMILILGKIVIWNTFNNNPYSQESLDFILKLFEKNELAKTVKKYIEFNEVNDDKLFRDFVHCALNDFYKYRNYDIKINTRYTFKEINKKEIAEYLGETNAR